MILYHGSLYEVEQPAILKSEVGRDFGFAFYTTDIREQAERWAKRNARIYERRRKRGCRAIINMYEWNPDTKNSRGEGLQIMEFPDPSMEWLEMILQCRSNLSFRHEYDIVIGKIANDNVGETVSYVLQGIMRKEDAVQRLQFEKINNQIAFCTEEALKTLTFITSYEC